MILKRSDYNFHSPLTKLCSVLVLLCALQIEQEHVHVDDLDDDIAMHAT